MSNTETTTAVTTQIKLPLMWKVLLHNDDFTPMHFVVSVLTQIFDKSEEEANTLMMHVHENNKANIGLYTKEIALTKVLLTTQTAEMYDFPLLATSEEA